LDITSNTFFKTYQVYSSEITNNTVYPVHHKGEVYETNIMAACRQVLHSHQQWVRFSPVLVKKSRTKVQSSNLNLYTKLDFMLANWSKTGL